MRDLFDSLYIGSIVINIMFFHLYAISTILPKKKEVTIDFFLEQLVKHNQNLQAYKAEYQANKHKSMQAFSPFLPKLTLGSTYSSSNESSIFNPNPNREFKKSGKLEANAGLNIFKGFGDIAGLKAGKHAQALAHYEYYAQISKVFLEALDNLLQINEAVTKLEAATLSLEAHEKVYFIASKQFHNKAIALGDLKQAESERETRKCQQYQYEAEYKALVAQFEANNGALLEANYIVDLPKSLPSTYEEAEALMIKNNFDIQVAHAKAGRAKANALVAKSKFLPTVELFAKWNHELDHELDTDDMQRGWENPQKFNKSFGIQGSWNILNGFSDISEHQVASHSSKAARFNHQAVLLNARASLKAIWARYKNALEQRKLYENAIQGHEIAANSMMTKYESGSKTVGDVARMQDTLATSKERFASNERVLRLSAWRLTILIGELPKALQNVEQRRGG